MFHRRVSFNDISPDLIDPSHPQFKPSVRKKYNQKSILKPFTQSFISPRTIDYHNDTDCASPNSNFKTSNLDANHNTNVNSRSNSLNVPAVQPSKQRRLSNLTDEEILKLDNQYNYNSQNLDNFKFNQQPVYYYSGNKKPVVKSSVKFNNFASRSYIHKSITLNIQHEEYSNSVGKRLLVLLNFKNHSWNSINWLIYSNFLNDNDHLIISIIDSNSLNDRNSISKQKVFNKCQNFLNLIQKTFNMRIKITLEYIFKQDIEIKKLAKNIVLLYQPHLILIGTKSKSLNFKYFNNLRQRNILKFSSFMLKNCIVPIIYINNTVTQTIDTDNESIDSFNFFKLDMENNNSNNSIEDNNNNIYDSTNEELRFSNLIKEISDNSIKESKQYLNHVNNVSPLSSPKIQFNDSIIRNYTSNSNSNSNSSNNNSNNLNLKKFKSLNDSNTNIYKVKSLLDDSPMNSRKSSIVDYHGNNSSRKNSGNSNLNKTKSNSSYNNHIGNKRKNSNSNSLNDLSSGKKSFLNKIDFSLAKSFEKIGFKKKKSIV